MTFELLRVNECPSSGMFNQLCIPKHSRLEKEGKIRVKGNVKWGTRLGRVTRDIRVVLFLYW